MTYQKKGDLVYTPDHIAKDCVDHFYKGGVILDPCRGTGAFHKAMPDGSPYCEITEGLDFFEFNENVEWVIGNPPYSIFRKFFQHGMKISNNVVFLIPTWKAFSANGLLKEMLEWGMIKEIRHYGSGTQLGWSPLANAIGAIHIEKGYFGDIKHSFYEPHFIKKS